MSSIIPKNFQDIYVNTIIPLISTSANISATNITAINLIVTSATIPNIILTGSLNANFNSNTLGNLFTTNGNVGIGIVAPIFKLDISGTSGIKINTVTNTSAGLIITNNNTSGVLIFGEPNHSIYGKYGYDGLINTLNFHSLSQFRWYTSGLPGTLLMSLNSNGNLTISGTSNSISISSGNIFSTNSTITTLNTNNLTTGNINFTGTLSQNGTAYFGSQWTGTVGSVLSYTSANVIVSGLSVNNSITTPTLLATNNISSGAIYSTNITSSNIFASSTLSAASALLTNVTISTLAATNISSSNMTISSILATTQISSAAIFTTNITSTNVVSTNISSTNLVSNFTSLGNLISSNNTFANQIVVSQTVGSIVVTTSASLISNTNTIGNIFTTGGNVGINTVTPSFTLDIAGSLRVSSFFVNSSSIIATGGTTTLSTSANTNQFVVGTTGHTILLPNSTGLVTGAEYYIVNQSTQPITIGNNLTNTLNILFPNTSQFFTLTSNTGAGGTWASLGGNFVNGSTGNIGLNNTNPGTTLDIIGTTRIIGTNYIGNPNNTADNLGIFIDGNNNGLGYRLGIIKKNGSPPFFATNNISSFVFAVANNTDASQITTNSYNTIMTLSTIGNLTIIGTSNSISISSSNIFSSNISTTSLLASNLSSNNLSSTNITTTNLVSTFTSLGNLTSLTGTFANKVGTNQTVGTIIVTTSASLIGNTNTIGNIFTTGGNVGINTTLPYNVLTIQSLSDIPAINPDAFNSLIISEDQLQTTLRTGITQGVLTYSQYTGGTTGYIQLTPTTNGLNSQYYWNINPGNAFTCTFDHLAGGGSGADELHFHFYNTIVPSPGTYNNGINGYNVIFQDFPGGGGQGIYLFYNGTQLAFTAYSTIGNNTWHTSTITFFRNNIRVVYDGQLAINYLDTVNRDITTFKNYMGFGASTGGVNNNHRIRNIRISKFSEGLFQFSSPTSGNAYYSGGGNIGIGTNNPIYPLHVTGNIYAGPSTFTGSTGTINTIGLYTKGVFNSNINGFPATSGTVGNAIALRVRGGDDASIDFGVNSTNGGWLQVSNWASGYNSNYPLLLNPNGGNIGINTTSPQFTLDVSGTLKTISQTGLKTTFSGVANYSISIDLTSYQMIEIILHQNYTVNSQNCSIQLNGGTNWTEYGAVFVKNGSLSTPVIDNTNILFQNVETSLNDSFAVIKICKTSITGGRHIIDIRGSYCFAGVGQTRVDATGFTSNITSLYISVPSGTISGNYTIRNIV